MSSVRTDWPHPPAIPDGPGWLERDAVAQVGELIDYITSGKESRRRDRAIVWLREQGEDRLRQQRTAARWALAMIEAAITRKVKATLKP